MTGLYPFHHGVRANGTFRLEERNLTLAEILKGQGYRTAAAISAFVLDSSYGLSQGFEVYLDDLTQGTQYSPQMFRERAAELTNQPVFEWLGENADETFFLWVHYFDAHAPHLPPEPFRSQYQGNLYDGEIAYADRQLGELLERLSELGVRDKTLVVMTADHGEGLGEHGEDSHSLLLYDTTLKIPLIMQASAALPVETVIHRQASLVDVVPTVLELFGIEPPPELDGISLLRAPLPGPRTTYIETLSTMTLHGWAPLLGVRRDDYKFVLAPRPEIYDLRNDPNELKNLYEQQPGLASELRAALTDFVGSDPMLAATVSPNVEVDEEALQNLAALGYVTTKPDGPLDPESLMDPKDGVYHWERVQSGIHQKNSGDVAGAIETLEDCMKEVPNDVFALQILASAYLIQGRYEDALEAAGIAEQFGQPDPGVHLLAASIHLRMGEVDHAEARIQQALALQPDHSAAHLQLAAVAMRRREPDQALELMTQALELDHGARKASILNQLANFHLQRGDREKARSALDQALEIDAFNGEVLAGLAEILWDEGNGVEAVERLKEALRFNPVQPRALAVLCGIGTEQGKLQAAIEYCERSLEIAPTFGPAHANLGLAYRKNGELEKAEEIYRAGISRSANYDGLHQNLAQLLLRQGKADEAVEEFKAALKSNPHNSVALANMGIYHMKAEHSKLAQGFFKRALRVKPDYAFAHRQLGVLLLGDNQIPAAMAHLKTSLEIDPSQPDAGRIRFELDAYRAQQGDMQTPADGDV
jgi:arylsulfatase A-like enzyme/Tfp pilus assembly protein PilF